jgi:hypothetical protein
MGFALRLRERLLELQGPITVVEVIDAFFGSFRFEGS